MQVTPATLQGMFTTFDTRFQQAYAQTETFWPSFASMVPSKTEQNTYAWMAKLPTLRKWIGDRQLQSLASYSYTVVNDNYELTEELDRNKIEDDSYGLFAPLVDEMAWQSKKWPDYMLFDNILTVGESTLCWDGQNLFDAAHPVSKYNSSLGTYSNYLTSLPLSWENYRTARKTMMNYKGEDNRPLGIVPDLLLVPPDLEGIALAIINGDFIPTSNFNGSGTAVGNQTNILKGSAQVRVVPELAGQPLAWYLLCTKRAIKPFLFQQRMAPEFVFLNRPDDYNVMMTRKFIYGVQARGAAGFSLPFLSLKATG